MCGWWARRETVPGGYCELIHRSHQGWVVGIDNVHRAAPHYENWGNQMIITTEATGSHCKHIVCIMRAVISSQPCEFYLSTVQYHPVATWNKIPLFPPWDLSFILPDFTAFNIPLSWEMWPFRLTKQTWEEVVDRGHWITSGSNTTSGRDGSRVRSVPSRTGTDSISTRRVPAKLRRKQSLLSVLPLPADTSSSRLLSLHTE